jgi:hypothetical protein
MRIWHFRKEPINAELSHLHQMGEFWKEKLPLPSTPLLCAFCTWKSLVGFKLPLVIPSKTVYVWIFIESFTQQIFQSVY